MSPILVKTHQALDKAVDLCYRFQAFVNETKRIEFLFELYHKYTSGMLKAGKKVKKVKAIKLLCVKVNTNKMCWSFVRV